MADFADTFVPGLLDLEGSIKWARLNLPDAHEELRCLGAFDAPTSFDPRSKVKTEDQRRTNSCVGNGTSTAAEVTHVMAGVDTPTQLSRWACYILCQDESNIRTDSGATMEGAARALQKGCLCPEDLCPFPPQYHRNVSREALAKCRLHPARNPKRLSSYEDILAALRAGAGGITVGSQWTTGRANTRKEVTGVNDVGGQVLGGHCTAFIGYIQIPGERDPGIIEANSHSEQWGVRGFTIYTRAAVERIMQDGLAYVVSDLEYIDKPRLSVANAYDGFLKWLGK